MHSDLQALSATCRHFEEYKTQEIKELRNQIRELEQELLDVKMELTMVKALYKVWRLFCNWR
jgi:ribosomal protein L29